MSIVDWIFPKYCVECGQEGKYVCDRCSHHIGRIKGVLRYEGIIRKMFKEIKYRGTFDMVKELVDIWNPLFYPHYQECTVTAVPMHRKKERQRGYNQAELIARELARKWRLPYITLLIRTRQTQPMYGLSPDKRAVNVHGAIAVRSRVELPSQVLIVDDVWTTGATLCECARVLREQGVRTIWFLTVAR